MEYEDRLTVRTPEGLEVELALAGMGSRFASALVDMVLETLVIGALALVMFGLAPRAVAVAVVTPAAFLVVFGYHVLFETLASGRTPGKRAVGLRVVRLGGAPVHFRDSAVRNLLRLLDLLPPPTYGLGAIAILLTRRNQRLGDLVAGTVVVRVTGATRPAPPAVVPDRAVLWDVSAVTGDEVATVRRFLERRDGLTGDARARLARQLADRLRPKVAGADDQAPEAFLEGLAAAKAARG